MRFVWLGLVVLMVAITMSNGYAELLQIEPIYDTYQIGTVITINGASTADVVFIQISDSDGNLVENLQIIANGQFLAPSMISAILWTPGIYFIEINDGDDVATNSFQVVQTLDQERTLKHFDNFGGEIITSSDTSVVPPIIEFEEEEIIVSSNTTTSISLVDENTQLKIRVAELEKENQDLRDIILAQLNVIWEWIVGPSGG